MMRSLQHQQRGFTLVELLVALVVMAALAVMSWQALDGMQRVEAHTRARSDSLLSLQASLTQWSADLDALSETGVVPALSFDGRSLRLTRRDPLDAQKLGAGLQVVAWAYHQGRWMRWTVGDLRTRQALILAWDEAGRWGQTPIDADIPRQVALMPIQGWQIFYYRSDAWTHPLSADGAAVGRAVSAGGAGGAGSAANLARELASLPEGVRLVLDLSQGQALSGSVVKDWARPILGGGKS